MQITIWCKKETKKNWVFKYSSNWTPKPHGSRQTDATGLQHWVHGSSALRCDYNDAKTASWTYVDDRIRIYLLRIDPDKGCGRKKGC